jgi:CHAT domain-containing protein
VRRSLRRILLAGMLAVLQGSTLAGGRAQIAPAQSSTMGALTISDEDIRGRVTGAEKQYGSDAGALSSALDSIVSDVLQRSLGTSDLTLGLAERTVQTKRQHQGEHHPDNARPLQNVGKIRNLRGEYTLAVPPLEEACLLRAQAGGNGIPVADCLEELALALIHTSRLADAQTAVDRARAMRDQAGGNDPAGRSRNLGRLALVHRWAGRYDAARAFLDQAFATRRDADADDRDLVSLLLLKGDLFFFAGDIVQARDAYATGVSSSIALLDLGYPDSLVALNRQAYVEDILGNSSLAASLAERARGIGESRLAPCHDERASALNTLAVIAVNAGDYQRSRDLYERSLSEVKRCFGVTGADIFTPMLNLASAAERIGNFGEAERLFNEVLRSWSERYGPTHPFAVLALDRVAAVEFASAKREQARAHWLRVLDMRTRTLGPDHPDVASTLARLGEAAMSAGDTAAAEGYLNRSLEIYRRTGVKDRPDQLVRLLSARGRLQLSLGDPDSARGSFSEALAFRERVFGEAHPLTAGATFDLAMAQALGGQKDVAFAGAIAAERVSRAHLRSTISFLPESQALGYAAVRVRGLDLAVSIAVSGSARTSDVFDGAIQSRAVVLDELAIRSGAQSEDPEFGELRTAFTRARQRMANLSLRSLRDQQPTPAVILEAARKQVEDTEQALANASAAFRRERQLAEAGLDAVRRAMPDSSALVSFLRYDQTSLPEKNAAASRRVRPPTSSYVAFVISSADQSVSVVPLGAAASLDALIAQWHRAASRELRLTESGYRNLAAGLRRRLWDPIADHFGRASRVFIVPDGAINLVSFAALPAEDGYLAEKFAGIHYLSAERDLLPRAETRAAEGLLAVGGANFENTRARTASTPTTTATGRSESDTSARRSGCDGFQSLRFGALPGTRSEVQDIGSLWRSAPGQDAEATILTGESASEEAVKHGIAGRRIVHLATHGFFLDGRCQSGLNNTRAVGGLAPASKAGRPAVLESPLLLSGLALAGANRRTTSQRDDEDDGILTAEEVASLDLDGVEWAVLSACDTGLGEIKAGEGVFGLRRAFQIAGVRTVIMSLWSVEDQATRQWMRALYEARLQRKLDTVESVHEATLSVLRDRRSKGLSTHPFYWAAFVAAGDWR